MKYDHIVKYNGKYYPAGTEVPEGNALIKNKATEKEPLPFEPKTYTKSEITHLSTAELKNLAAEIGIEDAFERTGAELKKVLIEHFGL